MILCSASEPDALLRCPADPARDVESSAHSPAVKTIFLPPTDRAFQTALPPAAKRRLIAENKPARLRCRWIQAYHELARYIVPAGLFGRGPPPNYCSAANQYLAAP